MSEWKIKFGECGYPKQKIKTWYAYIPYETTTMWIQYDELSKFNELSIYDEERYYPAGCYSVPLDIIKQLIELNEKK